MNLRVKIINIFITLIVFATLVPFINVFPSYSIQAICMLGSALYIASPILRNPKMTRSSFFILVFLAGWLFISSSGFTVSRISYYVALVSFMLWAVGSEKINYAEKFPEIMIKATGLISAVSTIYFAYDKGAYADYARSRYPEDAAILIQDNINGNIAGLYNHYSKNGMVLSIAVGILFVSFLYSKTSRDKKRNMIMLLLCAAALLFTGKRGPVIFCIITLLICYSLYLGKSFSINKILRIISLIVGTVILFVVLSSFIPQLSRFLQRFEEAEGAGSIMMGRDIYYEYAISMFLSKPLVGHGWFSFGDVFAQNAHNVYLQLLAETGIVGFIFFIIAFGYLLYVAVHEYRRAQVCKNRFAMGRLLKSVFVIIFFILYGFTGNPLYDSLMLCPFFMAICILRYYHENHEILSYESKEVTNFEQK